MVHELTWKEAINQVLAQFPNGLHYNEIAEKIIDQGLRTSVGATPAATVNAQISASIKHEGDASPTSARTRAFLRSSPDCHQLRVLTSQHSLL